MTPRDLILEAREYLAKEQWEKAESLYKEAIEILQERLSDLDDTKIALWSTQAEFLQSKPWVYKDETREEFRNRILDSIRHIYKCSKLNKEYEKQFSPSLNQTIKQLILTIGCIVPEIETHVIITCPISLRQTEFGKSGTSIAGHYEKAICTICELDILDEKCIHEIGEEYDGKICQMEPKDFKFLHIAATNRPKDPRCVNGPVYHPKEEFYKKFDPELIKQMLEQNTPMGCTFCKETKYDPSEITPEKFFEIQGKSIDFDKKFKFPKFNIEKGKYYFMTPLWHDIETQL